MRILLDFFPIALFVAAYKYQDIYLATAVLMGATVAQSALIYALDRRLQTMQKATLGLILVFGSLTLALHDDRFIKWKPTVLYSAMALVLALAQWRWDKNFLKMMLGSQLSLPDAVWRRLTIAWVVYFAFMAASNAYVAALYSTDTWVNFKLWGYAFPLIFLVGQGLFIAKHLQTEPEKNHE
jgi:intracellular septation protein